MITEMSLQNQSNEVMTYVETFIQNETAELIYDNDQLEKWNSIVEELGLTGQQQVCVKEKSPVPFMHMKKTIVNVFTVLCPRKVNVTDFNVLPIPVEILDLIALSVREKYFDKIQVWYDDKTPDPVAVGLRFANDSDREKGYTWNMESYLIGKWGDVKRSFEQLTELAKARFMKQKRIEYEQAVKDAQRRLEDLETEAFREFGDNSSSDLQLTF